MLKTGRQLFLADGVVTLLSAVVRPGEWGWVCGRYQLCPRQGGRGGWWGAGEGRKCNVYYPRQITGL